MRGELRSEIESVLFNGEGYVTNMLNPLGVQEIWQDFLNGRTSWSRPWALYVLMHWCCSHLE